MDVEGMLSYTKESLIPLVDENNSEIDSSKNKLIHLLDDIEERVERFRRNALLMEEEKDILFSSIDAVRTSELISDLDESKKERNN